MEQRIVRKLEREFEGALAEVVIVRNHKRKYPAVPSKHTVRMMAKAAVAVYEAVVDDSRKSDAL